jgi:hypothetical protein
MSAGGGKKGTVMVGRRNEDVAQERWMQSKKDKQQSAIHSTIN